MRLLGIDYGLKKIGLALGDDESRLAAPIDVLMNQSEAQVLAALKNLIEEEGIEGFVLGLPERPGQEASPQKKRNEAFAELLKQTFPLPLFFVNEQFTSVESRRLQVESGSMVEEDAIAAMLILQEHLDSIEVPVKSNQ